MRVYRQISKLGSVMMNLGAGKSQGGDSISPLPILNVTIKINGVEHLGSGKISPYFYSGIIQLLDKANISKNSAIIAANPVPINKFTLSSSLYDENMFFINKTLCDIDMNNFTLLYGDLYRTKIKGSGTIQKTGLVSSGGFNMVTDSEDLAPTLDFAVRELVYKNNPVTSFSGYWVYYEPNNAYYLLTSDNGKIYKLPYNKETGEFSNVQEIPGTWGYRFASNGIVNTNGVNKVIVQGSGSTTEARKLYIFNFDTESIEVVQLSRDIETGNGAFYFWDKQNEQLVSFIYTFKSPPMAGSRISLDGTVIGNTGLLSQTRSYSFEYNANYRLTNYGYFTNDDTNPNNIAPNVGKYDQITLMIASPLNRISPNDDGIIQLGRYINGSFTHRSLKMPYTASGIVEFDSFSVSQGDVFEIECEIIGGF